MRDFAFLKKGGKILHIVLNNSSKFNLTFRRVEKKQKKIPKKENKFQKKEKKVLKKLCCVWFFFGRIDLIFFKVLIYKNCIVKEYFLLESRPFFLAMFWWFLCFTSGIIIRVRNCVKTRLSSPIFFLAYFLGWSLFNGIIFRGWFCFFLWSLILWIFHFENVGYDWVNLDITNESRKEQFFQDIRL